MALHRAPLKDSYGAEHASRDEEKKRGCCEHCGADNVDPLPKRIGLLFGRTLGCPLIAGLGIVLIDRNRTGLRPPG